VEDEGAGLGLEDDELVDALVPEISLPDADLTSRGRASFLGPSGSGIQAVARPVPNSDRGLDEAVMFAFSLAIL
jgi:hypothetical protein